MYEPPGVLPEGRKIPLTEENQFEPEKLRAGPRGFADKETGKRTAKVLATMFAMEFSDSKIILEETEAVVSSEQLLLSRGWKKTLEGMWLDPLIRSLRTLKDALRVERERNLKYPWVK